MSVRRRSQEGFVLLVVLALLVLLMIVASLIFTRANEGVAMSGQLKRQSIAQDRALMAMQRGIADLNASPVPAYASGFAGSLAVCTSSDPATCPCDPTVCPSGNGLVLDNGLETLDDGGGRQYEIQLFWWNPGDAGTPIKVVHAYGFHGYTGAVPLFTSEVLVEVGDGTGASTTGNGYTGAGL
jgi:hypothetical protein